MKFRTLATVLISCGLSAGLLGAGHAAEPIRIANVMGITGPLQGYAVDLRRGVALGLEYGTQGTGEVMGRKIEIIEKDTQLKPERARALVEEAYGEDGADIVFGPISSGVALATLPIAQEYEKILMPWGAADSITGEAWNRYVFRVQRNSSQDAVSNAFAVGRPGVKIATVAQDYAFGHDFVEAYTTAVEKLGARVVHTEFPAANASDFTPTGQRIFEALKDQEGEKYLFVYWAGPNSPVNKLLDMEPNRHGIEFVMGGGDIPSLKAMKSFPGLEGAMYYYYEMPDNEINDWLVVEHLKRFNAPPDLLTVVAFSQILAVIEAVKKTGGSTDSENLIAAMEGLRWQTPKGEMYIRPADHQALMDLYAFKLAVRPDREWAVPELTRVLKKEDMFIPIRNGLGHLTPKEGLPLAERVADIAAARVPGLSQAGKQ